ncbi:hypothetical protein E8E12_001800 [Didymella heteroderae]|uniref:NACHT domain-containing protein n=1 Tax=Didymella heteroderae TaxID=1769908 RepID=A0A9P5BVX3_9PLEO|nr:hypothetical protein E8E12_001800 [Didymella heteroderae]
MAEAVGLVASIIAILELSAKVLGYLNDVKDASTDRARCALEVANVHGLLEKLRRRIEERNDPDSWFQSARDVIKGGLLIQFEAALTKLRVGLTAGGRPRRAAEALRWKFKKEEVRDILDRVARLNVAMITALQMDQFEILKAVHTDTRHLPVMRSMLEDVQQRALVEDRKAERQALAKWISSSNYPAEHATVLKGRQKGTGEWFLRSQEFNSWLASPKMTLMCQGGRGTGKSMLSAIAIEHLLANARNESVAIAWVFINHKTQEEDNVRHLLAALLKQLVQAHASVAQHVESIFRKHAEDGSEISEDEVLSELRIASETLTTTYIVVDALDECINDNQRDQLLEHLQSLQSQADVRLLITSRVSPRGLQGALDMEIKARSDDLKRYVAGQTNKLPHCVKRSPMLQLEVQEKVAEAAGDMFLLATLYVKALCDQMTEKEVRLTLRSLGESKGSLDKAYKDVIARIESQSPKRIELAMRALSWVTLARRPLTESELLLALAVEADTDALDFTNLHEMEEVRSVCAGLIDVEVERRFVRLVHRTAQTYLDSIIDQWYPDARLEIARTCLTYLSYDTFRSGRCSSKKAMKRRYRDNEFVLYAAEYWGAHALDVQDAVCDQACSFLLDENLYSSAAQAVFVSKQPFFWDEKEHLQDRSLTAAQYIARYNLCSIMQQYLHSTKKDKAAILNPKAIDSTGGPHRGGTPLFIAATNGNVPLMALLIKNGAHDGGDIMHRAIAKNQTQVVLALLNAGVSVDSLGTYTGESALSNAVSKSRSELVQLLLNNNANIDLADSSQLSGTALITAALANDVCIITALLHAGAEPCKGGVSYDSPLEAAADKGHINVVNVLLDNELVQKDLNTINVALNAAAGKGRVDVAKSLLKAGANPDVVIENCNSLEAAVNNGHPELVKILYPFVVNKKDKTLDAYLSRAQQAASSTKEESENDVPALTDSDPESDLDSIISVTDALDESLDEDNLKGWADLMDKRNRWIRRDTFPVGGTDALSAHVTQKSSSSMGVYDDDSDSVA